MNVYRHTASAAVLAAIGVLIARWAVEADTPRAPGALSNMLAAAAAIPARLSFGQWPAPDQKPKITGYIRIPQSEPAPPPLAIAALPAPAPAPSVEAPRAPAAFDPTVDPAPVGAIESPRAPEAPPAAPSLAAPALRALPPELQRFAAAAALYRKNDFAGADALAAQISDPLQRAGLEWIALKSSASPDHDRLLAFQTAHENWPLASWILEVREGWLYNKHAPAAYVEAMFADAAPRTPAGVVALARAKIETGHSAEATELVRKFWREGDFDARAEAAVLKEFAGALTRADHKYRADRLLYAERAGAMRAASLAGPDEIALANARFEAMRGPLSARAIAAVPAALQSDPGLLFARVQDARRGNRPTDTAAYLAQAPRDAATLIDPDKWWSERRMVARELIDRGNYKLAYDLCAAAVTASVPAHVDAAFHAGWIALRFMNDPATAARHFAEASSVAITPLSVARANYWQGRAADALQQKDDARRYYERAAAYPIAYYGQLAARALGQAGLVAPRAPSALATGDSRWEATRIIELYYQAGLDDFATPLAFAAASLWNDEAQISGLADVLARRANATVNTDYGKIATERGFALDEIAFPTTGLPSFSLLPHSADIASVLAVARQESVFAWHAASGAGAKGMMQILPATAAMTARRLGVAYEYSKLVFDAAFNLQLGAAYLGQLIEDEGGSIEMALAAYNAGPGAVERWVASHGDPRSGAIDLVDWIELIPYDETRDYVQRVSENLGMYRARLAGAVPRFAQAGHVAPE